jgi:hypothetical protein
LAGDKYRFDCPHRQCALILSCYVNESVIVPLNAPQRAAC